MTVLKYVAAAALTLLVSVAHAIPITYTFSGSTSGSLNGAAFSNSNFIINIFGHTEDVGPTSLNLELTANLTSHFSFSGLGDGSFTDPLFFFGGAGEAFKGFGTYPGSGNLITFYSPVDAAFDLKSNYGPIVFTNESLYQFWNAQTTLGTLALSAMSPVTFTASIGGAEEIPEPGSLALVAVGLALGTAALKRRSRS